MGRFLKKLFDPGYKEFNRLEVIAKKVVELEEEMNALSNDALQNKSE